MKNKYSRLAERVFETLKGYGYALSLYDKEGNTVVNPSEARRFFLEPSKMLVSIIEVGENSSLNLYLSSFVNLNTITDLVQTLRKISVKNNVTFSIKKYEKAIEPRDFAYSEVRREQSQKIEEAKNPMYGSKKSSYQKWNEAKIIIRHTKPIYEEKTGIRSRNISKIFIETTEGERFKFPVVYLSGARAMANHINNGGFFFDSVGTHISNLSEEYKGLQKVNLYINCNKNYLNEDVVEIKETIKQRLHEIRKQINHLTSKKLYASSVDAIKDATLTEEGEFSIINEYTEYLASLLKVEENGLVYENLKYVAKALFKLDEGNPLGFSKGYHVTDEPISILKNPRDPIKTKDEVKEIKDLDDWFENFNPENFLSKRNQTGDVDKMDKLSEYVQKDTFIWFKNREDLDKVVDFLTSQGFIDRKSFSVIDADIDYGIEFKGPALRDSILRYITTKMDIEPAEKPEMGPYPATFRKKIKPLLSIDSDIVKRSSATNPKDYVIVDGYSTDISEKTLGGDKEEDLFLDTLYVKDKDKTVDSYKLSTLKRAKRIKDARQKLKNLKHY